MIGMERMAYKGFESTPKHSAEDGMFYGTVDDVDAVVMYDSETAAGLEAAFMEAVDDYLDFCEGSKGAPFASEAEACDFADAAARDAIDGLCGYARCGVRFVDIRYADECLGGDSV